jgi:hypothetical protein
MKNDSYAPFIIYGEDDDDEARLSLLDNGMFARRHVFAGLGRESNGYSWASLAKSVAKSLSAESQQLDFNPEADMLSIYGPASVLRQLARALQELYMNERALGHAIELSEVD